MAIAIVFSMGMPFTKEPNDCHSGFSLLGNRLGRDRDPGVLSRSAQQTSVNEISIKRFTEWCEERSRPAVRHSTSG